MNAKSAFAVGFFLGISKRAKMGCAANPVGKEPSALFPRRYGSRKYNRSANFNRTDRITRPAMKV